MLLTIDVGNSSTSFGIFEGNTLKRKWHVKTQLLASYDLNKYLGHEVVVSSVVPDVDKIIKRKLPKAKFISAKKIKGLRIRIKGEVGADRAVNAYAARELYGSPAIVVDFGTATTFDVISKDGEYLGGAIVPGIQMSADALHSMTAKLPRVEIKKPNKIIGNSTVEAIRSGVYYGYIALVQGMIENYKLQMLRQDFDELSRVAQHPEQSRGTSNLKMVVIVTGGYAKLIGKSIPEIDIIDQELTLKGLNLLCQKN